MRPKWVLPFAVALAGCHSSHRPQQAARVAFEDVAAKTGLVFLHRNGAQGKFHLPEIMGSGVALFDYDGDGDLDIYLVQGAPAAGGNRLFRNELAPSGALRFTDVTAASGTGAKNWGMGVAVGDYDGDGDPDLLVTNVGWNTLYRNDLGTFTDVTQQAGLGSDGWHTSAAFADYDRDGDLDIFICRYVDFSSTNAKVCRGSTGDLDYCTPRAYRPVVDRLFRNERNGTFREVSIAAGIGRVVGPGLGVTVVDFNQDGWPDIYVANDGQANHLWMNARNGTFTERALEAGIAFSEDGMPQAGMGIAAADYDNDGDEDLLVTNLTREGATLYRNEGGSFFFDVSAQTRLRQITFAGTGFGTGWLDYNNDGCLDLFIANGGVTVIDSQRGLPDPFRQQSQVLRGDCQGFRIDADLAFEGIGRGVALGDIDRDGDVDIVMTNNNGPVRLLLNQSQPDKWLRVDAPATSVIHALSANGRQARVIRTDGSYLSSSEPAAYFSGADIKEIQIRWPDGAGEHWKSVGMNRAFAPKKGTGSAVP